jgi:hypothetical protein
MATIQNKKQELDDVRRIIELDVKEVSLVDKPAIRREFLVIKRLEDAMGAFKNEAETNTPQESVAKGETKPQVDDTANTPAEPAEPASEEATPPEDETIPEVPGDKDGSEKSGTNDEEGEPVAKASNPATAAAVLPKGISVQISPDGSVSVHGEPINKGKTFTAGRIKTIKEAIGQLMGILSEVDEPKTTEPKTTEPKTTEPKTTEPTSKSDSVPVVNDGEDKLIAKLNELVSAVKDTKDATTALSKRVDEIEGIRPSSTSVDGEGGTDQVETKKGFWDGVV